MAAIISSYGYDSLFRGDFDPTLRDSLLPDSNYDAVTAQMLERARQHYQDALEAEQEEDSSRAAVEFEYAIGILNELGYYPNIEANCDFNDLSHSVIEDYEKYIAVIDSLNPNASIFALRKKLNQIDEASETPDQDQTQKVITTTSIPLVINGHVEQNIAFLQGRGREHFEHWLYQSGKYFPVMRKVFRESGIPEELMYLSMIESGLNPVARSWARAVGLWQFVKGTGYLYGLHSNFWYDERRDFEKATVAAAHHLKDLYSEFGDWYLALAAYNSGAGRVNRAMRRSGSNDFWKMRRFLPRETRNYVPQYIAAAVMSLNPREYGFDVAPADSLRYELVTVSDCVDLSILAACAGADEETMRELNPELVQLCTPPGIQGYQLRVPRGSAETFAAKYSAIPDDQKRDWVEHKVKRRESIYTIARKYGVPAALIVEANHLRTRRLPVGKSIVIPIRGAVASLAQEPDVKTDRRQVRSAAMLRDVSATKSKLSYRIRKGDTLGKIAALYGVRLSDLRLWNGIPYGSTIQAGGKLTVWIAKEKAVQFASVDRLSDEQQSKLLAASAKGSAAEPAQHTSSAPVIYVVKSGETLSRIAQRFGVPAEDVRKWNGLTSDKLFVGQKLEVMAEEPATGKELVSAPRDTSKAAAKAVSYRVRRGDTLSSIASNFGVSIRQLKSWNNIRGSRLHVGQEIVINS